MRWLMLCLTLLWPLTAAAQEDDRGFIQGLLEDALSNDNMTVRLEGFQGALSSRATVDRITIADPQGVWLTAEDVGLQWDRSGLLRGRVDISEISMKSLDLPRLPQAPAQAPTPEAKSSFALPDLPVALVLEELRLDKVTLGEAVMGEAAVLTVTGSAALAGGEGEAKLQIERQDKGGTIALDGRYSNATRVLGLDLTVAEPENGLVVNALGVPGLPSMQLTLKGEAPVDDFEAQMALATDGQERLSGTVVLRADGAEGEKRFRLDVGGDVAALVAPQYREFLGNDLQLAAEVVQEPDGTVELSEMRLAAQALVLEGYARVGADGWPERLDLQGRITPPEGDRVVLPLAGPETSVERVTLTGIFDAAKGNGWQLRAQVAGFERAGSLRMEQLGFTGGGEIARETGQVSGVLDLDAQGLVLADDVLSRAVGDRLSGKLGFDWRQGTPLTLRELDLAGADYGLTGQVEVAGIDTLDIVITPDVTLKAERLERFAEIAGTDLAGAAALGITGRAEPLTGAFDIALDGRTVDLRTGIAAVDPLLTGVGTLRAEARRDATGFHADLLRVATGAARIEGTAALASGQGRADLDVKLLDTALVLPGVAGESDLTVKARQQGTAWTVDLNAAIPDVATLAFAGTVDTARLDGPDVSGRLDAQVSRLSPFSRVAGRALSGAANLTVTGEGRVGARLFNIAAEARTVNMTLDVAAVDPLLDGVSDLSFKARRGQDERFVLEDLNFQGQGTVRLDGTLSGTALSDLAVDGHLRADLPKLSLFSGVAGHDLSGAVVADVTARGTVMQGPLDLRGEVRTQDVVLSMPAIDPLLAGQSRVVLDATREEGGRYVLSSFDYRGVGRVTLDGTASGTGLDDLEIDGRVQAQLSDLAPLSGLAGRSLSGSAQADVTLYGTLMQGPLAVSGSASSQQVSVLMPAVDPLFAGALDLRISAERDALGLIRVDRLALTGPVQAGFTGTVAGLTKGQLQVQGRLTGEAPNLGALRRLSGQNLSGSLQFDADIDVMQPDGPVAVNGQLTAVNLGIGNPTLDPFLRGTTRVDLDVQRSAGGALRIERLTVDGASINGAVSGSLASDSAALTLNASVSGVERLMPDLPGTVSLRGTAGHSGGDWRVDLEGSGPGGIGARVNGTIAQSFGTMNLDITGSAPLALANARLAPQVVSGVLTIDLAVRGAPALSSVSGRVSTSGARFAAPAYDISVEDLSGGVTLAGGRADLDLSGRLSTGGTLRISGPVGLSAPFPAQLVVDLGDAGLRKADLFETTANGRITIDGGLTGGARIAGRIDLGQVEVRVPSLGPSYRSLDGLRHEDMPQDVQRTLLFAGLSKTQKSTSAPLPPFPLDVTVSAPNRIFVRGRGLDAELGGSLRLRGTTADIVPVGQFDLIRGRLDLLGRRLDLTTGEVSMRGSFTPYVNFAATTVVEDTEITIALRGEVSQPELTVSSSPDLPQDEALAFFLFGRGVDTLSPLQAVQLAAAIRTLSGEGGLGLQDSIRSGLGVDNLDLGTADDGTVQASVGKYISEKIYTEATVDADGNSTVNLNLTLTPSVTVRGRVGSDGTSGLGVFFERDY
ncbi:translocation/assembly module TamB domain-containing protein [Sagittula salina]|uniref:Translocation/assembly module TamB domain-containing protein n=1 Tax=Sagittula salina TaxID=2820268 RepID=A0A940MKC4_9RHOB|nr:translocation/assembly module TamB domain-containing protein [Sagittula salina]MBP0481183.1 translocation/assembly module TamB domain-containing protein [Sagittula salina]